MPAKIAAEVDKLKSGCVVPGSDFEPYGQRSETMAVFTCVDEGELDEAISDIPIMQ